jgi:hypothetical protein
MRADYRYLFETDTQFSRLFNLETVEANPAASERTERRFEIF